MINELTEKELASSGGKAFLVLMENEVLKYKDNNVYVKIVVESNKPQVKFGYFRRVDGSLKFIDLEDFSDKMEQLLESPIVGHKDFSSVNHLFASIEVELNPSLRMINYSRLLFKKLSKTIYFEGVSSSLTSGDMEISIEDVNRLYDFFENRFVSSYLYLLHSKILPHLKRQSGDILKTYLSFKNFTPVMFSGNCVVNPFLDSYRIKRVFMETDLFAKCKEDVFRLSEDSTLYMITNREICESLNIKKYIRFYTPQLTLFLLGLFDENKFPSTKGRVYIDENGRPVGTNFIEGARQVSSLYSMCLQYVSYLCPPSRIDEYISVLSTATL